MISFDTYQFAESFLLYSDLIQRFLEQGGGIAWGVVPTDSNSLQEEETDTLIARVARLVSQLVEKGVDRQLLYTQSIITPACGTGTLTEAEAERIYQLTNSLAAEWKTIINQCNC